MILNNYEQCDHLRDAILDDNQSTKNLLFSIMAHQLRLQ